MGLVVLWPDDPTPPVPDVIGPPAELADASVTAVERRPCEGTEPSQNVVCQEVSAKLTSGGEAGDTVSLEVSEGPGAPRLGEGDGIVVGVVRGVGGVPGEDTYYFS